MTKKKLVIKEDSVDFAIQKGLKQLYLAPDDAYIQILKKEKQTLFGYQEAIIAIYYSEEDSEKKKKEYMEKEFKSKFNFRFKDKQAQVSVPSIFYDKTFLSSKKERINYLREYIKEQGIEDPDEESLEIICHNKMDYDWQAVKEMETLPLNDHGGAIWIEISEDKMSAQAIIFHEGRILPEQVYRTLREKNIIRGVLPENIKAVITNAYPSYFEIARGAQPKDDSYGEKDIFFQEDEQKEFAKMMELLTIDTRSIKDINLAERNQLLIRLGEPTIGEDGYTVTGDVLKRKELAELGFGITLGSNVYLSDNQREIYSNISGHIKWNRETAELDVEPVYVVEGNVDFSEGNIIGFVGKVIIKGDVRPKFKVIAEGDIEIHGSVEDATVRSSRGDVFIGGSVIHNAEGSVVAAGTAHLNIATNAKVRAKNITVQKEVMNSSLIADDTCEILGTPGVVIGGEVAAKNKLRVNIAGSESWVPTKLSSGDVRAHKTELRSLSQQVNQKEAALKEAREVSAILQAKERKSPLTKSQKEQLEKAKKEIPIIQDNLQYFHERMDEIKIEIKERSQATLEIHKTLHPQVDVRVYRGLFIPDKPEQYTGFKCVDGEVERYSL